MTRLHTERLRLLLWAGLLTLGIAAAPPAHAICVGDCDGDNRVTIAEAQNCVNLAADLPAPPCEVADQNLDGHVDANEVDACIRSFLDPSTCPQVFTPAATLTRPPNTPTPLLTNTPVPPTNTATPRATNTLTRTPSPAPPTPTATTAVPCPQAAGQYTVTQISGGQLKVYTFAPFPFPAGGSIVQDVAAATMPECVHDTVVPFPGGFTAPNFCVPALGYTVSVTQTGCGVGKIDSNGGSDFTVAEVGDTSDSSPTCNLPHPGCPGTPVSGADASVRVDITVGDGTIDTCATGTGNSVVTVPVHTVTWQDNSPGVFGSCAGDGKFNAGDAVITEFNQILDFTTDSTKSKWMDIDGDGCSLAGGGPFVGQPTVTGACIDFTAGTVKTVASGVFGSTGLPYDGSFSTSLPATIAKTGPFAGVTCASPPAINFAGKATRCIP
jgi:hypothetical protein